MSQDGKRLTDAEDQWRRQAWEAEKSESEESNGEETEQDEDQEDTEDDVAATAQLPASCSHQQQGAAGKSSRCHEIDTVDTTEEESGDEHSSEQEGMERSSPGPHQVPNGRAADNGAAPFKAPSSRDVNMAMQSGAAAASGQLLRAQHGAPAAAINGTGNACNARSVTPDTDTSEEARLFLRVTGAYTPAAAAAELAADVAGDPTATSPSGRRQVEADAAWAAAADLAADVAGNPADVAPPSAFTSPLRKSPQKFKSVTSLHSASAAENARRLLSGGTSGNADGGPSAAVAAVAQQPSPAVHMTQRDSAPSQGQTAAARTDGSSRDDMPLLQRMRSLHASPDRLKSRASHSSQNTGEPLAARQMPGVAGSSAAAGGAGPARHAGGPTTAVGPGGPAATAAAWGGPAGTGEGPPATPAAQRDLPALAREVLATAPGGPTAAGTQGVLSGSGDYISTSQGIGAEAASWLVNEAGRSMHEASAQGMGTAGHQSREELTDMPDDSEQTMTENEDDEDSSQSGNPMDQDFDGGRGPSNPREHEHRDLSRQPSYHWPTRGEMEVRRSGFTGANGTAPTREQRGVVLGLSAQARMRDLLKEVLNAMAKRVHTDKRRIFQEQVCQMAVPDYSKYVTPENEVWTNLIRQRVNKGEHTSLAALLRDFEQMAANARAYNTPGAGSLGGPYLIDFAEEILRVVKEEGERRATQFAELEPLVADEAARGLRLEHVQRYVRPTIVLPEGFTVRVVKSQAKPRGYMEYVASCPIHGSGKRLDRVGEIITFLSAHSGCREEWNEWGPQPDETRADYELRVKDTFHFRRKEVPPHLINTVTVPGMYGAQRTGGARPGSSRGDAPTTAAQRTWHAAADQPTRKALITRMCALKGFSIRAKSSTAWVV